MPPQLTNTEIFQKLADGLHPVNARDVARALRTAAKVSPHDTGVNVSHGAIEGILPAFADTFRGSDYPFLKTIAAAVLAAE